MTKKRALPPDRLAECKAAHDIFLSRKAELRLSQKKLADLAGITPPAVNLYFKGHNPLNVKFATVLAHALRVPVSAFSPRLAREIERLSHVTSQVGLTAAPHHLPGEVSQQEVLEAINSLFAHVISGRMTDKQARELVRLNDELDEAWGSTKLLRAEAEPYHLHDSHSAGTNSADPGSGKGKRHSKH
jgi:transcriptional regulator with XRE-family HTH domain